MMSLLTVWSAWRGIAAGGLLFVGATLAASSPAAADWNQVRSTAMALNEKGHNAEAYELALGQIAQHRVDASFLAGWLAMRGKAGPVAAAKHFARMATAASTPDDKAAAGHWLGLALHASGSRENARAAWLASAAYGSTFYGQASAARLGSVPVVETPPEARFTSAQAAAMMVAGHGRRALEAQASGQSSQRNSALAALADEGPRQAAVAAWAAEKFGSPSTAVRIARRWQAKGVPIIEYGFPEPAIAWHDSRVRRELVLAVIREESSFEQSAESPVGAQGSMQVMDGTASHVGDMTGIDIDLSMMRSSRDYNIAVGSHYLGGLLDRYSGSVMLALAAYNAGPGRADEWISRFGDPRSPRVLPADWVERIPFRETREYVKRVMASYVVYLSKAVSPAS